MILCPELPVGVFLPARLRLLLDVSPLAAQLTGGAQRVFERVSGHRVPLSCLL